MDVVAYMRVSTDEQAESGLGMEAQRAAIVRAAAKDGWNIVTWRSDEGVSGSAGLDRRPGLLLAVQEVPQGGAIVVAKRDRLARDYMLAGWIDLKMKERDARVLSAAGEGTDGDDPSAMLMRRIVDVFADYERMVIQWRTRTALEAKRARGEALGNTPFGYGRDDEGRLIPSDAEQASLAVIIELDAAGHSCRFIANELVARGLKPRLGRWTKRHVREALAGNDPNCVLETILAIVATGVTDNAAIARRLNETVPPPDTRWRASQVARIAANNRVGGDMRIAIAG